MTNLIWKIITKLIGHRFGANTYTHHFKKRVRAMGIKDIHLHNLRHTAATYMLKSGIDIKTISKILGHASVTTTEIYADFPQIRLFVLPKNRRSKNVIREIFA